MTAKLLLTALTTTTMLAVVCRVGPASWGTPATGIVAGARSPSGSESPPDRVVAEGRLVTYPGAEVVVAAELAGTVVRLPVREKSTVRKGDLIAELGSDELRASRDEAAARVEEAEAEARFYEREVERRRVLIARRSASDVELDTNLRGLDVSRARRRAAIAARDRYDALIAKTRITSPIDGAVIARFADPGETLGIAAPLVTVADLSRVRIEAEVDEIDFAGIAAGAEATISAEGFPGTTWRGRVEEIPDVVVGRQLRPEDTGRPVDTRVLLVKIALLEPTPLKLGQRVEVQIARPPS
jgi:RND family efflux transporter MFP subunit